jgi:hypothetical protein
MRVEIRDADRILSSRFEPGDGVWTFVLVPEGESTRLLSPSHIAVKDGSAAQRLGMLGSTRLVESWLFDTIAVSPSAARRTRSQSPRPQTGAHGAHRLR